MWRTQGRSFREVVGKEIAPRKPAELKTASIHVKPYTSFIPDFYVQRLDGWIVYPWEYYETTLSLLRSLSPKFGIDEAEEVIVQKMRLPAYMFEKAKRRRP